VKPTLGRKPAQELFVAKPGQRESEASFSSCRNGLSVQYGDFVQFQFHKKDS